MKLTNPGAGELTDRVTILSLKLLYGKQADKDVSHFRNERTILLKQLAGRTLNGIWFESALDLAATNAALWRAEDDLRECRRVEVEAAPLEVAKIAFTIQDLNDQRALLIDAINKHTGEASGQEKV